MLLWYHGALYHAALLPCCSGAMLHRSILHFNFCKRTFGGVYVHCCLELALAGDYECQAKVGCASAFELSSTFHVPHRCIHNPACATCKLESTLLLPTLTHAPIFTDTLNRPHLYQRRFAVIPRTRSPPFAATLHSPGSTTAGKLGKRRYSGEDLGGPLKKVMAVSNRCPACTPPHGFPVWRMPGSRLCICKHTRRPPL